MIHRIIFSLTIASLTAVMVVNAFAVERQNASPASPEEIEQLLLDLSDQKFAVREEASDRLAKVGADAIPALLAACQSPDMEVSYRAIRILETIGLEGSPQTLKRVMDGLLSIAGQDNEMLIKRSRKLAARYDEYKTQIAVAKLRKMGATVQEYPLHSGMADLGFGVGFVMPIEADLIVRPRVILAEPEETFEGVFEIEGILDEAVEADDGEPEKAEEADESGGCGTFDEDEDETKDEEVAASDDEVDVEIDEETDAEIDVEIDAEPIERVAEIEAKGRVIIRREGRGIVVMGDAVEGIMFERFARPVRVDGDQSDQSQPQMSRSITIDQNWKGGAEGLKLLAEVAGIRLIQFSEVKLDSESFQSLMPLKDGGQISFRNCTYDGADMLKFAASHQNTSISAVGIAMMGVYPTQYTSAEKAGCELQQVAPTSAAEKAGMKAGDVIVEVDGEKVVDFPTLTYTVAGREVGDTLNVIVKRDGKPIEMKLTLSARDEIE